MTSSLRGRGRMSGTLGLVIAMIAVLPGCTAKGPNPTSAPPTSSVPAVEGILAADPRFTGPPFDATAFGEQCERLADRMTERLTWRFVSSGPVDPMPPSEGMKYCNITEDSNRSSTMPVVQLAMPLLSDYARSAMAPIIAEKGRSATACDLVAVAEGYQILIDSMTLEHTASGGYCQQVRSDGVVVGVYVGEGRNIRADAKFGAGDPQRLNETIDLLATTMELLQAEVPG